MMARAIEVRAGCQFKSDRQLHYDSEDGAGSVSANTVEIAGSSPAAVSIFFLNNRKVSIYG